MGADGLPRPSRQWLSDEIYPIWNGPSPGQPDALPAQKLVAVNGADGQFAGLLLEGVQAPSLYVFRPRNPNGSSLLILPGGGYVFLSLHGECIDLAYRLMETGTTCFLLLYRLPSEGWANSGNVPLQDAQRAMRFIRALSGHFGIDPTKLGVVGFSAGAHLAATLATRHDEASYPMNDAVDTMAARPDFVGLLFPVINLRPPGFGTGLHDDTLLGKNPTEAQFVARTPSLCVTAATSPCFIVHAMDDPQVPLEHSLEMVDALRAGNIPVEAHFFQSGGHGFDITLPERLPASHWPHLFRNWFLRILGMPN